MPAQHIHLSPIDCTKFIVAIALTLVCTLTAPEAASAMTARPTQSFELEQPDNSPLSVRLSAGLLNGLSHEMVYEDNGATKISELIWRLENVPMAGLSASLALPHDIRLNLCAWTKIGIPEAVMDDYDWTASIHPTAWTHHSNTSTNLARGEMFDLNLSLPVFSAKRLKISGLLGFRHDHWRWEDHDGYYVYSSNPGFRDLKGTFPSTMGITYEQWLYAPYVGLRVDLAIGEVTISGHVSGTKWAWADDEDNHINRNLVFKDSFRHMTYVNYGAEIAWPATEELTLSLSIDAQQYQRKQGLTEMSAPGGTSYFDKGAGADHSSWMTGLSLEYRF